MTWSFDPTREQLTRFLDGLEPSRFYVNDALAALASRSMFNVIEPSTGFKADLVIRKDRPFSASIHGAGLDVPYLRRWARELGVKATLETELGASGVTGHE